MFGLLMRERNAKAYGVRLEGVLCAGVMIASCTKRMHYLLSVSSRTGRERQGMFMVIDRVIQKHSGTPVILDFEGSNIPSIARFFKGFGAQSQLYQRIDLSGEAVKLLQKIKNRVRNAQ